jgi:hypothetical protein
LGRNGGWAAATKGGEAAGGGKSKEHGRTSAVLGSKSKRARSGEGEEELKEMFFLF